MKRARAFSRCTAGLVVALAFCCGSSAHAGRIILKDGTIIEGAVGKLGTLITNPTDGQDPGPGGELIVLIDDGYRRVYTSLHNLREVNETAGAVVTKFTIPQPVAEGGAALKSLGRVLKTTEWDEFGRRTIRILLSDGPADVIQGITLITPQFFRVQTLSARQRLLIDQRYATSNLPTPLLRQIIYNSLRDKKNNPDERLRLVRFFIEAKRDADAEAELETMVEQFPDIDFEARLQAVRNSKARLGLDELKLRRQAGQHKLASKILANFPAEDIAGETLIEVREILADYQAIDKRIETLRGDLKAHLEEIGDASLREQLAGIVGEVAAEVNSHTLDRLSPYLRLAGDKSMSPAEKLALAVSGWLVGFEEATNNLPVAMSLVEVRRLVHDYLIEEAKIKRSEIITRIRSQEGGIPRLVAKILSHMKPPLELPEPIEDIPGFYQITVPGQPGLSDVTYLVQLPPEYDPYRRYPVVVTLHGAGTTAMHQIDWWAGGPNASGLRRGQGTRHGYIVVAPQWAQVKQQKYEYTGREHAAVLDSLRDACRRFAVDTDRVFLSGHSMGGDAAWDIGISHPDLWAGVIPIVATTDSRGYPYNALYWRNAKHVPLYFVGGELDGAKLVRNAQQFDRYLNSVGFDVLISDYLGRGHESFYDEIINLFDWMNRKQRNFFPKEFACRTIRSFDNYFWWVEINQFPKHVVANPAQWPPRRIRAMPVTGKINETDEKICVRVESGRTPTTVWLSPELVDFDKRIDVDVVGYRRPDQPKPDITVMLEDARTRGDRMHPFWARVDVPELRQASR
jgi:predicted esterase